MSFPLAQELPDRGRDVQTSIKRRAWIGHPVPVGRHRSIGTPDDQVQVGPAGHTEDQQAGRFNVIIRVRPEHHHQQLHSVCKRKDLTASHHEFVFVNDGGHYDAVILFDQVDVELESWEAF